MIKASQWFAPKWKQQDAEVRASAVAKGEEQALLDALPEIARSDDNASVRMAALARRKDDFKLLRGPAKDDHTLYCSHSLWADRAAFEAWTKSEQFRHAHRDAGDSKPLYLGPPEFEGFEPVEGA